MSLVGTRPILQDELLKYELHHRARIAIKPGITGMWQVSGRSDITDFEEVVRLDTEYISNVIMMVPFSSVVMWTFKEKTGNGWKKILWYSGKIAFIFSVSIEMLQLLFRLGTFQLSDIFYNTVGGVLGGLVYYVTMKARKHL